MLVLLIIFGGFICLVCGVVWFIVLLFDCRLWLDSLCLFVCLNGSIWLVMCWVCCFRLLVACVGALFGLLDLLCFVGCWFLIVVAS